MNPTPLHAIKTLFIRHNQDNTRASYLIFWRRTQIHNRFVFRRHVFLSLFSTGSDATGACEVPLKKIRNAFSFKARNRLVRNTKMYTIHKNFITLHFQMQCHIRNVWSARIYYFVNFVLCYQFSITPVKISMLKSTHLHVNESLSNTIQ